MNEQEAILAQSQLATGTGAIAFRALVSADMEFPVIKDGKGNDATLANEKRFRRRFLFSVAID